MTIPTAFRPFMGPALKGKLFWGVIFSLPFLIAIHTWDSGDTFMHLNRGRLILETGNFLPLTTMVSQNPEAVFYWGFQGAMYCLFKVLGVTGLTLLFAVLWTLVWGLLVYPYRKSSSNVLLGGWIVVATLSCIHRITLRPEVISYLFIGVYLYLFHRWETKPGALTFKELKLRCTLVVVIQAVWASSHGYFFFGTLFLFMISLIQYLNHKREEAEGFFLLGIVSFCASAISPFGFRTWKSVWNHFFLLRDLSGVISEFGTPMVAGLISQIWILKIYVLVWNLTLIWVHSEMVRKKQISFELVLCALGLYLGATAARMMPLFFLFGLPLIAKVKIPRLEESRTCFICEILILFLVIGINISVVSGAFYQSLMARQQFGFGLSPVTYSVALKDYFGRHKFRGLLFNQPEMGGYLAYYSSDLKVYGDTLFTDTQNTFEYISATNPEVFPKIDKRYYFDAVLLGFSQNIELINQLLNTNKWKLVYADLHYVLISRIGSLFENELPAEPPGYHFAGKLSKDGIASYSLTMWARFWANRNDVSQLEWFLTSLKKNEAIPTDVLGLTGSFANRNEAKNIVKLVVELAPQRQSASAEEEQKFKSLLATLTMMEHPK